jgi:hypothetical protein
MKNLKPLFFLLLFTCESVFAQSTPAFSFTNDDILNNNKSTPYTYSFTKGVVEKSNIPVPILSFVKGIDLTQQALDTAFPENKFKVLYSDSALNLLFAKKLGTAFSSSNDLSLQKTYFNIDALEKSLSLGYNFDFRNKNPLAPLKHVLSIGAKIVALNGFATIATGGNLEENNIGLNLKYSFINKGKIGWFVSKKSKSNVMSQREKIEKNREFLLHKYNQKTIAFNKNDLPKIVSKNKSFYGDKAKSKTDKQLQVHADKLMFEMINEELEYVESSKLFSKITNSWITYEAYIPLGHTEYDITPIKTDNTATKANYYAFNTNLSYNWYKQKPMWFSYFGKVTAGLKGNSSIAVNNLTAIEFQSITTTNGASTLTAPVNAIDVEGNYEKFINSSLKFELALFYKNTIGISPSIEKNFGTYDGINWKIGIPLSLKDKEGKPTVNFELQWKENKTLTSSQHLIGFSTSFFFGDLL